MNNQEWIKFDSFYTLYKLRKFKWYQHPEMKYVNLTIDTRDNRCIVKDRDGKILFNSTEEMIKFFEKADQGINDEDNL